MPFGEGRGFDGSSFGSSFDRLEKDNIEKKSDTDNSFVITETEQETDFKIEITEAEIKEINDRIEIDREKEGLEGLGGSQAIVLETVLERKREEAAKTGADTEKAELTHADLEKFEASKSEDIKKAAKAIEKEGEEKGLRPEQVKEEIKSEKTWIEDVQASYLAKILRMERNEKEGGVENVRWNRMVDGLKILIKENKWDKVIPRAGQLNDLDPEKFSDISRSLFDLKDKENLLQEIEAMRQGKEGSGQKENPLKLASNIRYVSECFPDLNGKIKITGKEHKIMEKYLAELQGREWAVNELTAFGKKEEYWKVAHMKDNMKIVQKMINEGKIKVTKEDIEKKDSAAE